MAARSRKDRPVSLPTDRCRVGTRTVDALVGPDGVGSIFVDRFAVEHGLGGLERVVVRDERVVLRLMVCLEIHNVAGLEHVEIEPGGLVKVLGGGPCYTRMERHE